MKMKNSLTNIFDANVWSHNPDVLRHANCYAYALDLPDAGQAFPGQLAAEEIDWIWGDFLDISVQWIKEKLDLDGLYEISEQAAMKAEKNVFVSYVDPGKRLHFIRKDAEHLWSHKLRNSIPKVIHDWRYKKKFSQTYPSLAGYFKIPETGLDYVQRLEY